MDGIVEEGGLGVEALVDERLELLARLVLRHVQLEGLSQIVDILHALQLWYSCRQHLHNHQH